MFNYTLYKINLDPLKKRYRVPPPYSTDPEPDLLYWSVDQFLAKKIIGLMNR